MRIETLRDGPICGSLNVLDDVNIGTDLARRVMLTFTVKADLIEAAPLALQAWEMVKQHVVLDGKVVVIYPGNGGWLVQRLIRTASGKDPSPFMGVDISRVSEADIEVPRDASHVVVMEDVIEFGTTAARIRNHLNGVPCGVTLASMVWHDHAENTSTTIDCLEGYDRVLIARRIRSCDPNDDVRSLSTLARKSRIPKNQRYSAGREAEFLREMWGVLYRNPWLNELGRSLGFRRDSD